MKILALQGSPRRNRNTATLLNSFLEGVKNSGRHSINKFILDDMGIKPCMACDSCRKPDSHYCVIKDDMQKLYSEFLDADTIVLATPIYWWGVSSQLKLFIDRLYGLNYEEYPERCNGKKIVLILTYGGEDPNSGADLVIRMFEEIAGYTGMEVTGVIRYCSGDREVSDCPEKLREAWEAGANLNDK